MKKIYLYILTLSSLIYSRGVHAVVGDAGILGGGTIGGDPEACITGAKLRTGDVHLDDIPCMLKGMIDMFMGFAASIAVIFVIIGAYQILFGSIEGNKTKGKETIMMALGGFALAALSWIIIKFILSNFS